MRGQRSRRSGETSGVTYWRMSASAAGSSGDEAERVWRVAERPLTAAAEAFDRAGRESYRPVPARTDTGTALRFAARWWRCCHPVPGCAGGGAHRGADGAGPG